MASPQQQQLITLGSVRGCACAASKAMARYGHTQQHAYDMCDHSGWLHSFAVQYCRWPQHSSSNLYHLLQCKKALVQLAQCWRTMVTSSHTWLCACDTGNVSVWHQSIAIQ